MTNQDLSAVIGFELGGKGFSQANRDLDAHAKGWERVDQMTSRIGQNVGGMMSRLGGLGAAVGMGSLILDFTKLEDVASRAALAVGQATGSAGYSPYRNAIRSGAVATRTDATQLGASLVGLQSRVGGSFLNSPDRWRELGVATGGFSRAFGVDPGTIGESLGQLMLAQKVGPGSTRELLATIANQAAKSGQAGQTAQWLQAITATTSVLGGMHPGQMRDGASRQLGAMYGAVTSVNPSFKDPALFAQGVAGVDQAVTQAYRNPRLQASMQMAGIDYRMQRGGLAGPQGQEMAERLMRYSEKQYGRGTIEQDLFLRSNFGDVSADMLTALASGKKTYRELTRRDRKGMRRAEKEIQRRSDSDEDTPSAKATGVQQDVLDKIGEFLGLGADFMPEDVGDLLLLAGAGGALAGGRRLLRKRSTRKVVEKALAAGGRGAGGAAAGAAAGKAASPAARAAATAAAADAVAKAAGAGTGAAAGGAGKAGLTRALALGSKFLGVGVGSIASLLLDPATAGAPSEGRNIAGRQWEQMSRKFGDGWWNDRKAIEYARKRGMIDVVGNDPHREDWWMRKAIQQARKEHPRQARGAREGGGRGNPDDRFDDAVKRFERAIREFSKSKEGGNQQTAYATATGGLNSAGAQSSSDVVGSNMMLARFMGGATAGGGGGDTGGGGGGGAGGQTFNASAGGGGWQPAELTWYDPALGGTNSGTGRADPDHPMANGAPYNPRRMTCAAPKRFAFGTRIQFRYRGKSVTCTVTDRGGAINGNAFDLSRGAANAIGLIRAGRARGEFRVVGGGSRSNGSRRSGGGSQSGGSGGLKNVQTAAANWMSEQPAAFGAAGAGGGGGGGGDIVVNVDGRTYERVQRLTRRT